MKILFFSDYYHPTIKSGSIVIKDLASELSRVGHEAIVVTFNEKQKEFFTDKFEDIEWSLFTRSSASLANFSVLERRGMLAKLLFKPR